MTPDPWIGIGLTLGVFGALLGGLSAVRRRGAHPEVTRKGVHVGMGLITLAFPWLFDANWPVVTIAAVSLLIATALRRSRRLRAGVGGAIGDVERSSLGEFYFPIAVALTFVIADGDAVLYAIPILILTFADPAAAAVGLRYGKTSYTTGAGRKTTEGSAAFVVVAFVAAHWVLTETGAATRAEALLIALTLGLSTMVLEAVSRWGADNLLVPVGSVLLLRNLRGRPQEQLLVALAVLTALFAVVLVWRRRSTLNDAALLGAALYGYVAWGVGGWRWLLPPLTLFLAYPFLAPTTARSRRRARDFFTVMSIAAPGAFWLIASTRTDAPGLLYGYTLGFACHMAIILLVRMRHGGSQSPARCVALSVGYSWLLILGPFLPLDGWGLANGLAILCAPVAIGASVLLFRRVQPELETHPTGRDRWLREAAAATLGSLPGLIPVVAW